MKRYMLVLMTALVGNSGFATAEENAAFASKADQVLAASAAQNKFTFIVFYKQDDGPTRAMVKTIKDGCAGREDESALAYARATDPSQRALAKKYGMERAPLPMAVAVAPNGAITGIFKQKVASELIAEAFVSPSMAHCMKSMQEGKIVLVCLHGAANSALPAGVSDFQKDPLFADRVAVIPLHLEDSTEAEFFEQMQIEPAEAEDTIVVMAPPGVLVGRFASSTTKDEIAAAIHEAGKCCDDPNCKHGKPASAAKAGQRKKVTR